MDFDLDYARQVIEAEAGAISSMVSVVNRQFQKAADMIYECTGSVILSGIGKAGIVAQKISATLASTGTPSHFVHPAEAVHGDLGKLRSSDIVIVLSYTGETDEIIRMINLVKRLSIRLIAITGEKDSTLAKNADALLCMGEVIEAGPLQVAPSASTACMLAIGDALSLTVMKARKFSVEDYVRFHPGGSLGTKLMTVEQSMMFKPDEKLPLTGQDDSIGRMLAATKKIKRHGAVMVVDDDGKLAGVITDADLRRTLTQFGDKCLDFKAGRVMTKGCKKIRADSLAAEATAMFHKYRIDELPVVDSQGRPVGLIDVQDIVTLKVVG